MCSTHQNPHCSNTSLHFRKLSELSRNTIQFDTLRFTNQNTSHPPNANKYILKHLQHTFQLLIYHTSRFTHQNPHCSKYNSTFQKTIRLIAEHSLIWHFVIYQSKHFSSPNAIKYILKHLQHTFQLIIYHTSRFTHQNAHCSKYITTFQKTIRLIADNSLIWHFRLPIKTLLAYQRN